jgi:hypothetical protein
MNCKVNRREHEWKFDSAQPQAKAVDRHVTQDSLKMLREAQPQ